MVYHVAISQQKRRIWLVMDSLYVWYGTYIIQHFMIIICHILCVCWIAQVLHMIMCVPSAWGLSLWSSTFLGQWLAAWQNFSNNPNRIYLKWQPVLHLQTPKLVTVSMDPQLQIGFSFCMIRWNGLSWHQKEYRCTQHEYRGLHWWWTSKCQTLLENMTGQTPGLSARIAVFPSLNRIHTQYGQDWYIYTINSNPALAA